jgi:ferredoxin
VSDPASYTSYASEASYQITLVFPDETQTRLEVGSNESILGAAYDASLDLPSMCLQGWCITCAGRVEGGGEWDQSASCRYFPEDREAGFILLCTAKARSELRIRTHQRTALRDYRISRKLPTPRR